MPPSTSATSPPPSQVTFVVPYFGTWPKWSELFFLSCRENRIVSILLLSESAPPFPLPSNIRLVVTPRSEIIARLESVTGLSLGGITGHKLCDFRPFFGTAFADLLAGHTFWGFCDTDIMFGDLGKLLTQEFLDSVDVFTAHETQCAGHFTILRNVPAINDAGFRMPRWEELCREPLTRLVEERVFPLVLDADPALRIARPLPLDKELKRPFARLGITFDFQGRVAYSENRLPAIVRWEDGSVFYVDANGLRTEALYVHFMGLKRWWHWCFYRRSSPARRVHVFSRIGYAGIERPEQLQQFHWLLWYRIQLILVEAKGATGRLLRKLVPSGFFLQLRRLFFGRSR